MMRRSKGYLSQGAIGFLICRFLAYITSTINVGSFRLQSSRPFGYRNVNSVTLVVSEDYPSTYKRAIKPDVSQMDAIVCKDKAILVVAGPGSGKTRVMASRLAYLLNSNGCKPSECLVISFTSSAATNLLDKTREMCSKFGSKASTVGVFCDTFHGFCNIVIKENVGLLMDSKGYCIASDEDQMKIMTEIMESNGMKSTRADVKNVLIRIRYWKELGLGYLGVRKNSLNTDEEKMAYKLYPLYQSQLKMMSALDFGDLLLSTLRLFRQYPKVLDQYRSRFKHILVDEFQDVSPAQYDILRMLVMGSTTGRENIAGGGPGGLSAEEGVADWDLRQSNRVVNLFCAGDDDQSIYAYRGAKVELMQRFRFDFPGSRVLKFGTTYRLPDTINRATQSFISTSSGRILKPLVSFNQLYEEVGEDSTISPSLAGLNILPEEEALIENTDSQIDSITALNLPASRASIEVRGMHNETDEVEWVTSYLKEQVEKFNNASEPEDYSIVVLTRHDSKTFEGKLKKEGIPFSSRNFGFWNQQTEYAAQLNLLRFLASPDDDEAFTLALDNDIILSSISKAELLATYLPELRATAVRKGSSLLDALRELVHTSEFYKKNAFNDFLGQYVGWTAKLEKFTKGKEAEDTVKEILQSAFSKRWNNIHVAVGRLSNSAAGYDSLHHFVSAVRLEGVFVEEPESTQLNQISSNSSTPRNGNRPPKLTIWVMAMHAAKGLEFDEVILPFWSKGTSMDLEDERKIAFMSLTRAKKRVMISYSNTKWARAPGIQLEAAGARSPGIKLVTTGASLFVDKLLNIPGLRVTHEHFEQFIPFNMASSQQRQQQQMQQQQIAYNKGPSTYSSTTRDAYTIADTTDKNREGQEGTALADQSTQLSKYDQRTLPPMSRDIGTASSLSSTISIKSPRHHFKASTGIRSEESTHGMHAFLNEDLKSLVTSQKSMKSLTPTSEITVPLLQPVFTTSALDAIVVENVSQAFTKKLKKRAADVEFPNPLTIEFKEIAELLIDLTIKQSDLRLYLREVIKVQLNLSRGSTSVGGKTKKFSDCTAKELAEFIKNGLIKKHGT